MLRQAQRDSNTDLLISHCQAELVEAFMFAIKALNKNKSAPCDR